MKIGDSGLVAPMILCKGCGKPNTIPDTFYIEYFLSNKYSACDCAQVADAWEQALHTIKTNFMLTNALDLINAYSTITVFELQECASYTLKFKDIGIPKDAKILHINFTPQGDLYPLEFYGSNYVNRNIRAESVQLYPMPFGESKDVPKTSVVNALITWIPATDDELKRTMISAFEFYIREMYESAVVPANVVVETQLFYLINSELEKIVSKNTIRSFSDNTPSYNHQLNIILPLMLANTKIPMMDEKILTALYKLRKIRNKCSHPGQANPSDLSKDSMAEYLCGALFAYHYFDFVKIQLSKIK